MAHERPAFHPAVELSRRGFLASALTLAARPARPSPDSLAPLLSRFPALAAGLPHVALGTFPTPIDAAERLGRELGGIELWVKRDDLTAPHGGGKTRKLECLLADALARKKTRVATFGGFGSNHCVATAYHAAKLGLETELYVLAEAKSEHAKANLRAMLALANDVEITGSIADATRRARAKRPEPYVIPYGGSSALGSVPFAAAAFELDEQVRAGRMPRPDVIVMAAGTLGSAAGLGVGLALLGWDTELRAVRASSPGTSSPAVLARLIRETLALLGQAAPAPERVSVRIDGRELGGGYALPTAGAKRALELAREHAGLALELTYTAKALASVARSAKELRGKRVLFWHSAGPTPVVSGERPIPRGFRAYLR